MRCLKKNPYAIRLCGPRYPSYLISYLIYYQAARLFGVRCPGSNSPTSSIKRCPSGGFLGLLRGGSCRSPPPVACATAQSPPTGGKPPRPSGGSPPGMADSGKNGFGLGWFNVERNPSGPERHHKSQEGRFLVWELWRWLPIGRSCPVGACGACGVTLPLPARPHGTIGNRTRPCAPGLWPVA